MSVRNLLKKNGLVMGTYIEFLRLVYKTATLISPELNTKLRYKSVFGKEINLQNPQTFYEKLSWLKLNRYNDDALVAQCADKYAVREYIKECGFEHILNDIYGVYDSADEIPWDTIPKRFVLKWNFGSGMNILCKDKSCLNIPETVRQLNKWRKVKCWLPYAEMHYKNIPPKIVCEKFLEDSDLEALPDYKVYCFHGKPLAILVIHDRGAEIKKEFFDTKWGLLAPPGYAVPETHTKKPICLDEMLAASCALSKPFPFVRCDYYIVDGNLYFGELTFTPAGGMHTSIAKVDDKDMTDFLSVP